MTIDPSLDGEVDNEMLDAVNTYVDYVRSLPGQILVEQLVHYDEWVPDGYGTADAIIIGRGADEGITTIADLKYGEGVMVSAEANTQLMLYALGADQEYRDYVETDTYRLVISQPRIDHHSEWYVKRSDLLLWAHEVLKPAAELALSDNPPLVPGQEQCRYCVAKPTCRALANHCAEIVSGCDDITQDITLRDVNKLDNRELSRILPHTALINDWVRSVVGQATMELCHGRDVPGYKLVAGRSVRQWMDDNKAELALKSAKVKIKDMYVKRLISPAQAEAILGKRNPLIEPVIVKPAGKPTLVPVSDKRPALDASAVTDFADIDIDSNSN
jgi:hypothetical protein